MKKMTFTKNMINNFQQIKELLNFNNPDEFYFVQIIQRKKDIKETDKIKFLGTNNNNRLIKSYYIYSINQLDRFEPEIIKLCETFNARAGINLNKRNQKTISLEMLELLARDIRVGNYECISRIYNTVCGQNKGNDKIWLVDIDEDDLDKVDYIVEFINSLEPKGEKVIAKIPSKTGLHLITKKFNTLEFSKKFKIEIHKNNPVNLFIP